MTEHTPQFFLYDLTLHDLALGPLSITRYLCIDKNNTLSFFMLSGSIQFHYSVSV